jgi:hypothetical protein
LFDEPFKYNTWCSKNCAKRLIFGLNSHNMIIILYESPHCWIMYGRMNKIFPNFYEKWPCVQFGFANHLARSALYLYPFRKWVQTEMHMLKTCLPCICSNLWVVIKEWRNLGKFTPSYILHTCAFGTYLLGGGGFYFAKKIIRWWYFTCKHVSLF